MEGNEEAGRMMQKKGYIHLGITMEQQAFN